MDFLTLHAAIGRTLQIEAEIHELRRQIEHEPLEGGERQYVSRCFDLLSIELLALRQFLARIANS